MKSLILCCLLLAAVLGVAADRRALLMSVPKPAGGSSPTYLIEENFENTGSPGYDLTWTESSGSPDENYSTSGLDMQGSECIELNDGGTNERSDSPTFTATADGWFFCRIRFNSLPAGTETIISIRNGVTEMCSAQITAAGAWRLAMTGGNSAATTATMSAGTTYKVRIRYTAGSGANAFGSFEFVATGGTFDGSGTDYTSKADSTATLSADNLRIRSDGAIQLWMDRVLFDDAEIGSNP